MENGRRGGGKRERGRKVEREGLDKDPTVAQTLQGNYKVNGPRKTSSRYSRLEVIASREH